MDEADRPPGHALTQKEFGRLIGAPRSTIHDWYHGKLVAPIEHFLCVMERLYEIQRTELLRELCRDCPRLQHPRLAHDPQAVNSLRGLITEANGMVRLVGSDDPLRTFLLTAIGNSLPQLLPTKSVCGLDVDKPDSFVPVVGVRYFSDPTDLVRVKQIVRERWKEIAGSPGDCVLLNRVWSILPELRDRIMLLAKNRTVIVADDFDDHLSTPKESQDFTISIVRTTSTGPKGPIRIRVEAGGSGR
jgi:hypothetical protein